MKHVFGMIIVTVVLILCGYPMARAGNEGPSGFVDCIHSSLPTYPIIKGSIAEMTVLSRSFHCYIKGISLLADGRIIKFSQSLNRPDRIFVGQSELRSPQRKEVLMGQLLDGSLKDISLLVNVAVDQPPTRRPLSEYDFEKCSFAPDVSFRVYRELPVEKDEFLDREIKGQRKRTLINDPKDQCARSFNASTEAQKIRSLLESFGRL